MSTITTDRHDERMREMGDELSYWAGIRENGYHRGGVTDPAYIMGKNQTLGISAEMTELRTECMIECREIH